MKVTGRGGQGLLGTQLAAGQARLTEWVRVLGWGMFSSLQLRKHFLRWSGCMTAIAWIFNAVSSIFHSVSA